MKTTQSQIVRGIYGQTRDTFGHEFPLFSYCLIPMIQKRDKRAGTVKMKRLFISHRPEGRESMWNEETMSWQYTRSLRMWDRGTSNLLYSSPLSANSRADQGQVLSLANPRTSLLCIKYVNAAGRRHFDPSGILFDLNHFRNGLFISWPWCRFSSTILLFRCSSSSPRHYWLRWPEPRSAAIQRYPSQWRYTSCDTKAWLLIEAQHSIIWLTLTWLRFPSIPMRRLDDCHIYARS